MREPCDWPGCLPLNGQDVLVPLHGIVGVGGVSRGHFAWALDVDVRVDVDHDAPLTIKPIQDVSAPAEAHPARGNPLGALPVS